MSKYTLTHINIYPIKSLGGISLQSSEVEERGLKYDRRWMLVDESDKFITQRSHPQLSLIKTEIKNGVLTLSHKQNKLPVIRLPLIPYNSEEVNVKIWDDNVTALKYYGEINDWLYKATKIKTTLVFMPDEAKRAVNPEFAQGKIVSFADAFPFLIIGEESLSELNNRINRPVPMNRFRPNFVFSGGEPFDEDNWQQIKIGNIDFKIVKSCARCVITTIDQYTGEKENEPLAALAKFRNVNGKVLFGQNMVAENCGVVSVGDEVEILTM